MDVEPTESVASVPPRPASLRSDRPGCVIRWARTAVRLGLAALLVLGLVGRAVGDRNVPLTLMLFLPVIPLAIPALLIDLWNRGRALARPRFALTVLALAAILVEARALIGGGPEPIHRPALNGEAEVAILQWNILWGGGLHRTQETWSLIREEIASRPADLVILNEVPPDDWLQLLATDLGAGTSVITGGSPPALGFGYRLAVLSRWPLRHERDLALRNSSAFVGVAEIAGRTVRFVVVDGRSTPWLSRDPFLDDLAAICKNADAEGQPVDLLAGDFNAIARNRGFRKIEALGYAPAAAWSRQWRATWPAGAPLFDIDHVWIRRGNGLSAVRCSLFTNRASDHRGQIVRFRLPSPASWAATPRAALAPAL